ncbi:DUF6177 family protein [Actinomadura sp. WAC 06369]|uniref:DUF6177 family protein n=1 Tax=Actinomadura sp. WAC 06369 TaxID=2203193 RepID=UPI000F78F274|nr:DUF6177 family protein [Actinomadura sp. WAC 06369]RSN45462.1 hypothetical protein DMH08_36560 [Actinomadura sp. WAC 06369]
MDELTFDIATPKAGLVLQERTIVSASARVLQAVRACAESGRECVIVTPGSARLTFPLRAMIGSGVRWAVRAGAGSHFDGLNGTALAWDGERFVPEGTVHPAFERTEEDARWPVLAATVRHPAADGLEVGHAVEMLSVALTGSPPAGWGAAEPAATPWSTGAVTAYCRGRSPKRTWLCHVGGPALGTLQVVRTDRGVEERVLIGASVAVPDMGALVEALAGRFDLVSLTARLVPGRRDLTAGARWCGVPEPVGVAVGGVWRAAGTWGRFREVLEGAEGGGGRWG